MKTQNIKITPVAIIKIFEVLNNDSVINTMNCIFEYIFMLFDCSDLLALFYYLIIWTFRMMILAILFFWSQITIVPCAPKEYTPERITKLKPNEIFVFDSNLAGTHSGGAAWIAYECFGAIMGQGVGLQGQSYAIPTMQGGVETIMPYVDEFIEFAFKHPEYKFLVTKIGCGIAGFRVEEIAPLFAEAIDMDNVILPEEFVRVIQG